MRHDHHVASLRVGDAAQVRLATELETLRRLPVVLIPEIDRRDLRQLLEVEQHAPDGVIDRDVPDWILARRQHLADVADPVVPRVRPPEIIDPQEAALLEVGAQRVGVLVAEERRADVGGADDRALEQQRIRNAHRDVVRLAAGLAADRGLGQLAEPRREVDVRVPVIGRPSGAARFPPIARVDQAAEVECAIERRCGWMTRRIARSPAVAAEALPLLLGAHHRAGQQDRDDGHPQQPHISGSSSRGRR